MQPLPSEIKSYSVDAIITYSDDVAVQKEKWAKRNEEKIAENKAEKEEYKEKSLGNKLLSNALLDERKPEDVEITEKYFAKIYDTESLSAKIKIDGYETSESADVNIQLVLNGFEFLIEEVTDEEKKGDATKKEYKYKISYKHPIEAKLFTSNDEQLYYFEMPEFKKFKTRKTKGFASKYALEIYWQENKVSILNKLDEKVTSENLKAITKDLNSKFGYPVLKKNSKIALVKERKHNYDEYTSAFEYAYMGYSYLMDDKEEAHKNIQEAVNLWEEALKESDPDERKARIDDKVTAVTHLNCAEAYCWLNNYQKAKFHIMKLKMLNKSRYNSKMEACKNFIDDHEKRYDASIAE